MHEKGSGTYAEMLPACPISIAPNFEPLLPKLPSLEPEGIENQAFR
jgi:hypothetical protein